LSTKGREGVSEGKNQKNVLLLWGLSEKGRLSGSRRGVLLTLRGGPGEGEAQERSDMDVKEKRGKRPIALSLTETGWKLYRDMTQTKEDEKI